VRSIRRKHTKPEVLPLGIAQNFNNSGTMVAYLKWHGSGRRHMFLNGHMYARYKKNTGSEDKRYHFSVFAEAMFMLSRITNVNTI